MTTDVHTTQRAYPAYKDSGVEWLGEFPTHWVTKKLKYAVALINDKVDAEGSDLPYMGLEHIESWTGKRIEDEAASSVGTGTKFQPNDVLFGKLRPYLAKVHLAEHFGLTTTEALVLRSREETLPRFLWYYMLTKEFIDTVDGSTYGAKMPRASYDFIGNLPALLPPLPEQEAIARFLDHKTAQIDALIAKKEALLARLADKRTALISQAVTQGLDPTVPMRDSGIEWLGEIPEHWEVVRLRYLLHTNPSKSEIVLADDEMVSFIPMEAVGEYGGLNLEIEKPLNEIGSGYTYFADNDVVVAKITPCFENGKGALASGLTNGIAFGTTELHVLRPSNSLDHRFLFHLTMSQPFRKLGESEMYGAGGQKRIPESFIRELRLGIPPLVEQVKIAQFIDYQVTEHERLQFQVQSAIGKLKQYRTALITNAVTGKIDVRDVPLLAASAVEMSHA